jgi:hypothetical protein
LNKEVENAGVMEWWSDGAYEIPNSKHQISTFQVSGKRKIKRKT